MAAEPKWAIYNTIYIIHIDVRWMDANVDVGAGANVLCGGAEISFRAVVAAMAANNLSVQYCG